MSVASAPTSLALSPADAARRMEDLGRIIMAYSEVTERLERSHAQLNRTVQTLRQELSEKDRQLERKNRLAALGEMAAGLAHEIRNPLGGIQLYASMLAEDVIDRPESLDRVRKIAGGVKRLEALVGQVLQFTREIAISPAPADLAELVHQAAEYASPSLLAGKVTCEVQTPAPLEIVADPLLIGQALLNLILNAAEAAGHGGRVTVSFSAPPAGSDAKQFHLVVSDTGPGIDPQIMDRIFNPFFTTRDTGTGLGLSIVHRVVEAHEGVISVINPESGGARFEIRI